MNCLTCNQEIIPTKFCKSKKFCSARCREKNWVLNNKERDKELKRNWRNKTPALCKRCHHPIPSGERKNGVRFCSKSCRDEQKKENTQAQRKQIYRSYSQFKKDIGCEMCDYNRNGACLDFHHKNPAEKERRITAGLWQSNTELFAKERAKCILVCKNCHYELHHPELS